jgi:putative flippase GtrA
MTTPLDLFRVARFGIVGLATSATQAVAFLFLVNILGAPGSFSNVLAYFASLMVSYFGQSRWTFADRERRSLAKYGLAVIANLVLGSGLAWLIVDKGRFSSYWMLPVILIVLPATSYLMLGRLVFTHGPAARNPQ